MSANLRPPHAAQPAEAPPQRVSFEEFLAWSDGGRLAEWVAGEIIPLAPVTLEHQRVLGFLLELVGRFTSAHDLGEVIFAPYAMRLATRPSAREPDLIFVATANLEQLRETYLDGPADLAVEIISPDSEERDRVTKFLEYEAGGVPEYWLLDPARQEAYFYQRGADERFHLRPADADGRCHSATLTGFWLRPAWLWQRPLPPVGEVLAEIEVAVAKQTDPA